VIGERTPARGDILVGELERALDVLDYAPAAGVDDPVVDVRVLEVVAVQEPANDRGQARAGEIGQLAGEVKVAVLLCQIEADRLERAPIWWT